MEYYKKYKREKYFIENIFNKIITENYSNYGNRCQIKCRMHLEEKITRSEINLSSYCS